MQLQLQLYVRCSSARAAVYRGVGTAADLRLLFVTSGICCCILYRLCIGQCPSVCPSVRPSLTLVYCTQMDEDIVKLLCRPGKPIILVFRPPAPVFQLLLLWQIRPSVSHTLVLYRNQCTCCQILSTIWQGHDSCSFFKHYVPPYKISSDTPSAGALNIPGVGKVSDIFDRNRRSSRGNGTRWITFTTEH